MNFQFSGSIPNVHWHSNGNTMSSQSVTEFTILNGRVTVTRAANDTRNDVNVTIVANGRRNENPRQNCLCHREIRWRNRRRQGLRNLLCSVRDLKDHIYDATDELSIARRKLHDLRDEMQKVKDEVYKSQNNLKRATHELTKAVSDLQAPQLYSLNEEEAAILRYHLSLANSDIEDARKTMLEATNDLITEVPYQPSAIRAGSVEREAEIACTDGNHNLNSMSVTSAFPVENPPVGQNTNKCSVCLESTVNSVLYKCGHMCTCYDCAIKLQQSSDYKKCPVCRTVITDIIRIFVS